jgi:LytS/YehU family sensor histidine kinase
MRKVLQNSDKELLPLENELDIIRNYLELEALLFNFKYSIEVDVKDDIFNVEIPPLVLQPFG